MTIRNLLQQIRVIHPLSSTSIVEQTVADELKHRFAINADIIHENVSDVSENILTLGVINSSSVLRPDGADQTRDWIYIKILHSNIELYSSHKKLLYPLFAMMTEDWIVHEVDQFQNGKILYPTFTVQRPLYDLFLNQHARTVCGFDKEEYFKTLARLGYSHVEINGLAFPKPIEVGPEGEVYPHFYTYCPALDQFVTSKLNRGLYPEKYLNANLNNLKMNAVLAEKYGLSAGVVCFEPRSVPEKIFEKYPMLRGARVDHPLRSFKPRYNLSIGHPIVRDHYAEMMENLMYEVPSLDYISIWSNDSGAGFEYTHSLYVGRNGGGYIIREWKDDKDIAQSASHNLVRFLELLRDAGRKVNPNFRTLIRLEPFWSEHDYIWNELNDGTDVEVSSLLTKGWALAYHHPKYKEVPEVHGTALFNRFDESEKPLIDELRNKKVQSDVICTPGILWNHEPLIGIPFPFLVYEKLNDIAHIGVNNVCYFGGATPDSFAPFNINQELVRAFQFDQSLHLNLFLEKKATEWVGVEHANDLIEIWKLADEAVRSFPIPIWIYSGWGVWYRLLVRPIVPNIEAISEKDREYYEKNMLSTAHNRARVDFRYDVGFDLIEPSRAKSSLKHFDDDVFPLLHEAINRLNNLIQKTSHECFIDQYDRLRALRCWYRNQRNVAAWVAGVHGYLESSDRAIKLECKQLLHDMVFDEIENTKDLLQLWETSKITWIIISNSEETPFIYSNNFGEQLKRKIELMTGHENDEPYVDPDFQWRVPNLYA